jgi:hypothetical protein
VTVGTRPVVRTGPCPCCRRSIKLDAVPTVVEDDRTFLDMATLDLAIHLHLRQCTGR